MKKVQKILEVLNKWGLLSIDNYEEYIINLIKQDLNDNYFEYYSPDDMQLIYEDYLIHKKRQLDLFIEKDKDNQFIVSSSSSLKPGDIIISIDDNPIAGKSIIQLYHLLDFGTHAIEVKRAGIIKRELVEFITKSPYENHRSSIKTVCSGNWIYLMINAFGSTVFEDFLDVIIANKDKKLIIDLRNNCGGEINLCLKILKYMLNKGNAICKIRKNNHITTETAIGDGSVDIENTYVIVNHSTASAAELFTSAIQSNGGTIVGEQTYGKGVVQILFPFYDIDGSGIKVTVAEFLSSDGKKIDGCGICPDFALYAIETMTDKEIIEEITRLFNDKGNKRSL